MIMKYTHHVWYTQSYSSKRVSYINLLSECVYIYLKRIRNHSIISKSTQFIALNPFHIFSSGRKWIQIIVFRVYRILRVGKKHTQKKKNKRFGVPLCQVDITYSVYFSPCIYLGKIRNIRHQQTTKSKWNSLKTKHCIQHCIASKH